MVNLGGDDVLFLVTVELSYSLEAQVVAFSCSTGKHDLLTLGSNEVSDVSPCILACYFCVPTELVGLGMGITIVICQKWEHLVEDPWVGRCGCLVIKVQWKTSLVLIVKCIFVLGKLKCEV